METRTGTNTDQNPRLQVFDPLTFAGAVFAFFLALSNDPWWTLTGTTTSRLLNIQVSPFYIQTSLIGSAANPPFTAILGSFTRLFLILGFITLAAASIRPLAWWRQLAIYIGLTSLAETYLSFLLMFHVVQTALLIQYNIFPAYSGTSMLRANILGLDLNYYPSPLVTASFSPLFYIGFLSFGLVEAKIILKALHHIGTISALGVGLHEVYLSPPYQHVWLSSEDKDLNPLGTDPDQLTDDQLLVSFEKIYKAVEPGGIVDVILPAWATHVSERFQRLAPDVGFTIEKSELVYRTQGKPETEILLQKPVSEISTATQTATGTAERGSEEETAPYAQLQVSEAVELEQPPAPAASIVPAWTPIRTTRLERAILKAAIGTIETRRDPVPYRELLNQVYLDLVDRKIEFDSARQIESTLLNHSGKELQIIEEESGSNHRIVKKWWLGDQTVGLSENRSKHLSRLTSGRHRPKLSTVHKLLRKWQRKPRYRPRKKTEDE